VLFTRASAAATCKAEACCVIGRPRSVFAWNMAHFRLRAEPKLQHQSAPELENMNMSDIVCKLLNKFKIRLKVLFPHLSAVLLSSSRALNNLLLAYKIIFNIVDTDAADFFKFANSRYETKVHNFKLLAHYS
jgi:hypothetical protein